ncbi:helix-turn-helix domain-containing protein [Micromonospora sp. L32]|uniref:helix-turn-helix domain-containing protein n=1 Tax=Micromonospora sp. L32 TaxID=3452214 RepID=UPI003F8C712C
MTTQPSWDHRAFREYVIARAKGLGVADSTAELGRHVGIGRSMLSKWFSGSERPSPASLEKLAKGLRAPIDDLMQLAGWSKVGAALPTPPPPELHPLAAEVDQMLGDNSRLSEEDREALAGLVDRVLAGWRPQRNGRRRTA